MEDKKFSDKMKRLLEAITELAARYEDMAAAKIENLSLRKKVHSSAVFQTYRTIAEEWDPDTTDMKDMFWKRTDLELFPPVYTRNVTNFNSAFKATGLREVPKIDFSACSQKEGYGWTFCECIKLKEINNLVLHPAATVSAIGMFYLCSGLETVNGIDFGAVNDVRNFFSGCPALKTVKNIVWPTVPWNGQSFFNSCTSLEEAPDIDFSMCKQAQAFFYNSGIKHVGILETGTVPVLNNLFGSCKELERVERVDFASAVDTAYNTIYGVIDGCKKLRYLHIVNLGKAKDCKGVSLQGARVWGEDSPENLQSLVDSLLTDSFDRAAAGYPSCTISLSLSPYNLLTTAQVEAIKAKGYEFYITV